jgi:quercetin dioxygenase-like cupin family protein
MTRKGDTLEHPVTGEKITFLETSEETDGEYALAELHVRPHGFVAAPHIHPFAQEAFEISSGTFALVVDGAERRVRAGERATVPAGTAHAWWNAGEDEGVAIVEFRPALKAEGFFESFFGLAQDGKVSQRTGLPNVLWLASIFQTYRDFVYIARPPLLVQRAVFTPLGALAKLLGYRLPRPYPYPDTARSEPSSIPTGTNLGRSENRPKNRKASMYGMSEHLMIMAELEKARFAGLAQKGHPQGDPFPESATEFPAKMGAFRGERPRHRLSTRNRGDDR